MSAHALGYVRVSTVEQSEDGCSLDAQREKVRAYCDLHGLGLVGIESDEGLSGKRADNRPGLMSALDHVCRSKGILVVYSLSRLARSTRDAITIVDRLEKSGADLASISEKIDTTSSMGRFFFRLMASLSELERDQISDRTALAMGHLRKQGRRISGKVPFGFDVSGDNLIPNVAEQSAVAEIVGMRGRGLSYRQIASELERMGVRPKSGGRWHARVIMGIATRAAA